MEDHRYCRWRVQHEALAGGRVAGRLHPIDPRGELLDRVNDLSRGQPCSGAVVAPGAERHDLAVGGELAFGAIEEARHHEALRIVETFVVAVGRSQYHDHSVARRDLDVVEAHGLGGSAGQELHRREEAQRLCGDACQEISILATCHEIVPVVAVDQEVAKQARQRPLRGLDSRGEEKGQGGDDLLLGQRLVVVG